MMFDPDMFRPVSKNKVCSYLAQNQDKSCCSTETLQDIEKIVGQAKSFVQNQRWAMLNASLIFFEKTFAHRFNGILQIVQSRVHAIHVKQLHFTNACLTCTIGSPPDLF